MLALVGLASCAVVAPSGKPTPPGTGRVVAITFDDLPYASDGSTVPPDVAIATQRQIVGALRRARVPATGFVNEDKVQALGPAGPRLLAEWNRGLLTLGNHGYSHFDSNDLGVGAIEQEVVKGEATIRPMAASRDRSIPFFRFPYNHVGDTEAKRLAIEKLLAIHGYRLAASTIDTSDYLFNSAYERALAKRDRAMMQRIEWAYLDHSRVQIAYYGELDRKVLGREVPAIMLLHANRLNAATIEPLLSLFRSAGYGFVSLAQAQADPAYSAMPAVATKFGPMWGYRWKRERKVKVDGRLEQEPPAWIGSYAGEARYHSLAESVWALRSLQNRDVPRSRREVVTLRLLPDHGIAGTASCNSVGGREFTWTASTDTGGTFARDPSQPTITTVVGCNDAATTQIADQFWTLMTKAREWSINRGDLFIRFDDGTMAVLKAIVSTARTSTNCRSVEQNNLDCLDPVSPR